jgi:uncharacterized membrane protein
MDLAKSWVTAVVVYLTGSVVTVLAAVTAKATPAELTGTGGSIVWNALPSLAIYLVMAALSAIVHSAPQRRRTARHALAVLPVPALLIIGGAVVGLVQGSPPAGLAAGALGGVIGTAAGWWAAGRLRRRGGTVQPDGYF